MSAKSLKTVLVAGGAGFLGSHLSERLIGEGARVICIDSFLTGRMENLAGLVRDSRFDVIDADVIEPLADTLRVDAVYNLACAASPPQYQADPEHTMLTNVLGTRNLLTLSERCQARFLLASTSEVYGDPTVHPQTESYRGNVNTTGPRACYDEGKRAAEALAFDFARTGRAEVRVARIFNTYGPRMREDDGRVVSNVVTQALSGADITIYGDGQQTRSFCYVDDMVAALIRLMGFDGDLPSPVNLGNPEELTIADLVDKVRAMTGTRSRLVRLPFPQDDPMRRKPDIQLAAGLLDWRPTTPLDKGLRATVDWFRDRTAVADPARAPLPVAASIPAGRSRGAVAAGRG
jgi:UDP-glucuronate decarboxylase